MSGRVGHSNLSSNWRISAAGARISVLSAIFKAIIAYFLVYA